MGITYCTLLRVLNIVYVCKIKISTYAITIVSQPMDA